MIFFDNKNNRVDQVIEKIDKETPVSYYNIFSHVFHFIQLEAFKWEQTITRANSVRDKRL